MNRCFNEIKDLLRRASSRREAGAYVVEGVKMCLEAPEDRLMSCVVTDSFYASHSEYAGRLEAQLGKRFYRTDETTFSRLSDTKTPQGILMVLRMEETKEAEMLSQEDGVYVLLENLQDPGNLGTIIRSAEAAGISGIVMDESCCDLYNPKAVRSTMGSIFRMKILCVPDLMAFIGRFHERGGLVYAAHLRGSVPYDEADYKKRSAFIIGNESKGISEALLALSDKAVRIPMEGRVESLNAAMAATILMYEANRQRRR